MTIIFSDTKLYKYFKVQTVIQTVQHDNLTSAASLHQRQSRRSGQSSADEDLGPRGRMRKLDVKYAGFPAGKN
jgi:hypothetical protein